MIHTVIIISIFIGWWSLAGLLVYTWYHRDSPVKRQFFWLLLSMLIWVTTSAVTTFAGSLNAANFWYIQMRFIGIVSVPPAVFAFALVFVGHEEWITRKRILLACLIPMTTIVIVWLRPEAMVGEVSFLQVSGFYLNQGVRYHGWFWVHTAYSYTLVTVSLILLGAYAVRTRQPYRSQAALFVAGMSTGFAVNIVANLFFNPPRPAFHDLTALTVGFTIFFWAFSLFRYRMLDIMPVAHNAIIAAMGDAMLVVDTQNRIVDYNPAAEDLLGIGRSSIGQPIIEALPEYHAWIEKRTKTAELNEELRLKRNGQTRLIDLRISTLMSYGVPLGRLAVLRDITQKRLAEERDRLLTLEAERRQILTTFIRDASHEFRTPLSAIKLAGYMMARLDDQSAREGRQQVIDFQVERVNVLVDSLILMAKLDAQNNVTLEHVDLNSLLRQIADSAQLSYPQHTGTVEYMPSAQPLLAHVNEYLIESAFKAVINNSFQHTGIDSSICIQARRENGHVEVVIKDSGPGMETHELARVFERFYRADEAHSTAGFGLGLPIAKQIIEVHNGSIQVESEPETGTHVCIRLPAINKAAML
ncbi:MAG: PAS domain-containing protein [Anaerolineae bacterium]|nr:PAS domain-containing protein [Anaerolineae bacterium]